MDDYGEESLTTQKARVDRFIVPRDFLPEICRRMSWNTHEKNDDEIWSSKYLQRKRYSAFLDSAFHLSPVRLQSRPSLYKEWSWPCEPRRRSCLSTADNVLDLPGYRFAVFPNLIDWSNDDILVAALGKRYHKWSWVSQGPVAEGCTLSNIQCCKFDPKGDLLLGTHLGVEIHDKKNKCYFMKYCKCSFSLYCGITAVDWSPTGNSFVMGCSRGRVCSVSIADYPVKSLALLEGATLVVKVSPNARFVAAAAVHARLLWILTWPDLKRFRFLRTYFIVKELCWHPWQSSLLGIATLAHDHHATVVLWEPHSDRLRQERVGRGLYSIDSMRFNHTTGELLLCLWNLAVDVPYPKGSELVVMSDFTTVVDHWGGGRTGLNRVKTMVFSPDGTKLATATADEDLIIWNFLPNNYKKNKISNKFAQIPQFLDLTSQGFTIR